MRQPKYQSHVIKAPSGKWAVTEKVGKSKLFILTILNAFQHSRTLKTETSGATRQESTGRYPASGATGKSSTGQSKGSLQGDRSKGSGKLSH